MTNSFWKKPESMFAVVCLILSVFGWLFVHSLIGRPKVLFGESLTAITPSAFPGMLLILMAILCAGHLVISFKGHSPDEDVEGIVGWRRGIVFFGIMTIYGLVLVPLGFIISSGLAIAVLSWFVGNRVVWQIILVAATAPVLLYLAATRLLAVSLPELNFIELAISRMLGG
jgi:putative tricarboxylic transport membrane protein